MHERPSKCHLRLCAAGKALGLPVGDPNDPEAFTTSAHRSSASELRAPCKRAKYRTSSLIVSLG